MSSKLKDCLCGFQPSTRWSQQYHRRNCQIWINRPNQRAKRVFGTKQCECGFSGTAYRLARHRISCVVRRSRLQVTFLPLLRKHKELHLPPPLPREGPDCVCGFRGATLPEVYFHRRGCHKNLKHVKAAAKLAVEVRSLVKLPGVVHCSLDRDLGQVVSFHSPWGWAATKTQEGDTPENIALRLYHETVGELVLAEHSRGAPIVVGRDPWSSSIFLQKRRNEAQTS